MNSRLISLDFFRGLTIAAMIVVNDPGSWSYVYTPLRHADWHGVTPTDLVFPFFLFIVGISIVLALSKRNKKDTSIYFKIIKRTIIIFSIETPTINKKNGNTKSVGVTPCQSACLNGG